MIIDSHAYCFEPADSGRGYSSVGEHLKWVQAGQAKHHQPSFRIRDRAPASSEALAPNGFNDHSLLPDVNLRVDHAAGRIVWTIDGEDYSKYYYPPNLRNCEYTPDSLIGEMDHAGVDIALLHTSPMLGRDNSFQAECLRRFPDRLRSMAQVDEWRILSEPDAVIQELTAAIEKDGLHAIKFDPTYYMASADPWDDGVYRRFWQAATALDVPVFFNLGEGPTMIGHDSLSDRQRGYIDELGILMRWMDRYPDAVCSITHGFPWRTFLDGERIVLPEAIWEPFQGSKLSLEVCFPIRLGEIFDFPYREVWPTLEAMVAKIGADHLLWGTDMPFQNRFCTYRQSRDWIEKYCGFLSKADLDMIMGGTAARILRL